MKLVFLFLGLAVASAGKSSSSGSSSKKSKEKSKEKDDALLEVARQLHECACDESNADYSISETISYCLGEEAVDVKMSDVCAADGKQDKKDKKKDKKNGKGGVPIIGGGGPVIGGNTSPIMRAAAPFSGQKREESMVTHYAKQLKIIKDCACGSDENSFQGILTECLGESLPAFDGHLIKAGVAGMSVDDFRSFYDPSPSTGHPANLVPKPATFVDRLVPDDPLPRCDSCCRFIAPKCPHGQLPPDPEPRQAMWGAATE